jgi:hypothetical protein
LILYIGKYLEFRYLNRHLPPLCFSREGESLSGAKEGGECMDKKGQREGFLGLSTCRYKIKAPLLSEAVLIRSLTLLSPLFASAERGFGGEFIKNVTSNSDQDSHHTTRLHHHVSCCGM